MGKGLNSIGTMKKVLLGRYYRMNWTDEEIFIFIGIFIAAAAGLGYFAMFMYCMTTYGSLPITEVPSWALWFMWGH